MNENKYRGLTKEGKEVKGYYCKVESKHYILGVDCRIVQSGGKDAYINHFVEVDPETVGQFVCLDKNDKEEIYANDIVKWSWNRSHRNIKGVIEWDNANLRWIITNTYFEHNRQVPLSNYPVEKIGTGHENKDLLEETK